MIPMSGMFISTGKISESLLIMREAAQWLIDIGQPMWSLDELDASVLKNEPNDFIVLHESDGTSVATCLLSFSDSFFWPDIPANSSGFIHKLAIKREYADKGYATLLVKYAAGLCRERGIYELRLDCDPHRKGLCAFYENAGFRLVEMKQLETKRLGKIDLAMYKLNISDGHYI